MTSNGDDMTTQIKEAMDREEASKPENQAEAVDDREAQAIEADSARDTN